MLSRDRQGRVAVLDPLEKPLSPKHICIMIHRIAKGQLGSTKENNSMVGDHHHGNGCLKGSPR